MPDNDRQPYVEDADENEDPIDGSRIYTSSAPPSVKEEANVSRTRNSDQLRRGHPGSGSASPTVDLPDDDESDGPARAHRAQSKREPKRPKEAKDKARERIKVRRKSVTYEQPRPHSGRAKATPSLNIAPPTSRRQQEPAPSHTITTAGPASPRPRAYTAQTTPRPVSHYGSPGYGSPGYGSPGTAISRPPLSNTRYYPQPAPGTSFPPPPPHSPFLPHSPMFPPPSTAPPYAGQYPPPLQAFSPAAAFLYPQYQPDYFGPPRPMPPRPDYRRPLSAMGHRSTTNYINQYGDDHDEGGHPAREPSIKKRPSTRLQEEERKLMPPPRIRRSSTTVAAHSPFAPPRRDRHMVGSIRSLDLLDTDSVDDNESQDSPSEKSRFDWRPHSVRRPTNMDAAAYEIESRHESRHERSPGRRRRNSQYGARVESTEREYEDKFHNAQRYQEKLDGPTNTLTADTLRKMARTPSLRTKSTASRGGNEKYATLTNRHSIDTEDMRILVKGAATLTIGDASMAVRDGAEIRIPTNLAGAHGTSRASGGSNDSDTTYDDRRLEDSRERRARVDNRPQTRAGRATSHSRGLPSASGYYHSQAPPTEYSGHGNQYAQQTPMYAPYSGFQYPSR